MSNSKLGFTGRNVLTTTSTNLINGAIDEIQVSGVIDKEKELVTKEYVDSIASGMDYWDRDAPTNTLKPDTSGDKIAINEIESETTGSVQIEDISITDDNLTGTNNITFLEENDNDKLNLTSGAHIGMNSGNMRFTLDDDSKFFDFRLGGGSRLQISEDGSDCEIKNVNGSLILDGGVTSNNVNLANVNQIVFQSENNDSKLIFKGSGDTAFRTGVANNWMEHRIPQSVNGFRFQVDEGTDQDYMLIEETTGITMKKPLICEDTLTLNGDPTANLEASTKQYVDNHSSATIWSRTATDISPFNSGDTLQINTIQRETGLVSDAVTISGNNFTVDQSTSNCEIVFNSNTSTSVGIQFQQGGTSKWLQTVLGTNSDLVIARKGTPSNTTFLELDSTDDSVRLVEANLTIGSQTSAARGKLRLEGTASSWTDHAGFECYASGDTNPIVQLTPYNSSNIALFFGAYRNDSGTVTASDEEGFWFDISGSTIGFNSHDSSTVGNAASNSKTWQTVSTSSGLVSFGINFNATASSRNVYFNPGGTLGYLSSCQNHKANIEDIGDCSWVYNLRPRKYNRKKQDENGDYIDEAVPGIEYGLIAEEVELVNNELTFYQNESTKSGLLGVNREELIAPLVKIVQDQKTLIDNLNTEIVTLKSRMNACESRITTLEGYHV